MGTRNATFMLRAAMERAVEEQKDLFMSFIDFQKAFDTVRHATVIEKLRRLGVDAADLRVLNNLYWVQSAVVIIGEDRIGWVEIQRGIRQGCVQSPDLFLLYSQAVIEEQDNMDGVGFGGVNINNIRYADDTVLMADTEEKLQMLVDELNKGCGEYGLKVNIGMTEVLGVTKR